MGSEDTFLIPAWHFSPGTAGLTSAKRSPAPGSFWKIDQAWVLKRLFKKVREEVVAIHVSCPPPWLTNQRKGMGRQVYSQHAKCPTLGPRWRPQERLHLGSSSRLRVPQSYSQGCHPHWPSAKANNQTTSTPSSPTAVILSPPGAPAQQSWNPSWSQQDHPIGPFWQDHQQMWWAWEELCWFLFAVEIWSVLKEISSPHTHTQPATFCMGQWGLEAALTERRDVWCQAVFQ